MKALDQIWREYHDELLGFIRSRVGDADLAEDILQDVFTKAHSRLGTLADADRIQSWLYQIARNTIIDHYRTRRNVEPLAEQRVQLPEQEEERGQGLESCVLPMMKLLPEIYREAIGRRSCYSRSMGYHSRKWLSV